MLHPNLEREKTKMFHSLSKLENFTISWLSATKRCKSVKIICEKFAWFYENS